jgi:hypothetical protein
MACPAQVWLRYPDPDQRYVRYAEIRIFERGSCNIKLTAPLGLHNAGLVWFGPYTSLSRERAELNMRRHTGAKRPGQ